MIFNKIIGLFKRKQKPNKFTVKYSTPEELVEFFNEINNRIEKLENKSPDRISGRVMLSDQRQINSSVNDSIQHSNDNNKSFDNYVTTLLPAIIGLFNNNLYNLVIGYYILLILDYFTNFTLCKIKNVKLFNIIIKAFTYVKYISILVLLIMSIKR